MSEKFSSGTERVQNALTAARLSCEIVEMPSTTRTAQEAADAIGCDVAHIAKSLVFRTKSLQPILVIASGSNRVNEKTLALLIGETIEKPDADFVKEKTGFTIGGIPPVGHTEKLVTFFDEDLMKYDVIWAAAGTPFSLIKLTPTELERLVPDGKRINIH